jgi:hypothetical protein
LSTPAAIFSSLTRRLSEIRWFFDHLLDFFKDQKHPISDSIYFNKYIVNNGFVCDAPSARKNLPDTASKGPAGHSVNLPILSAGVTKKAGYGTAHIHCHRIANKIKNFAI